VIATELDRDGHFTVAIQAAGDTDCRKIVPAKTCLTKINAVVLLPGVGQEDGDHKFIFVEQCLLDAREECAERDAALALGARDFGR